MAHPIWKISQDEFMRLRVEALNMRVLDDLTLEEAVRFVTFDMTFKSPQDAASFRTWLIAKIVTMEDSK